MVFCFLFVVNISQFLEGKKYKKCVARTIEGIHFKICVNKTKIKKNEPLEIKLTIKIPKKKDIYVAGNNIWYCGVSNSLDTLFFCLGDLNIFGDRIPQLVDLKKISRKWYFRNKLSVKLSEIEKKYDIYLYSEIELKFSVSFCKKLCEPLKEIILREEWSHWANQGDDWYINCYEDLFRNFILDETIGTINIKIKE